MNYLKSEQYRMHRKKGLYLTAGISLSLVVAAIYVLYFVFQSNSTFQYATNTFLYSTVLNVPSLIIFIGLLFTGQLLGSDKSVIKQSVSFGISRNQIYFTKLLISLTDFIFVCLLGLLIVVIGGEFVLTSQAGWMTQFFISVVNLTPLVIAGFVIGYTFMFALNREIISALITLFIFNNIFEKVLGMLETKLWGHRVVANYVPHTYFNKITELFTEKHASFSFEYWLYSFIIIAITLVIALPIFNKKDI